ncbi:uncharacterized protein N7473_002967 [Penicillium subrubescens]|uniref:Uncharacterized protein n=1 Tax=Penicillium subrubescens TaxID=1316194 RepID=A0A1Q5TDL4_9EURO|nr:uncharacterized protein N7473_002967 [Penicillium subrubescens]KAJ5906051.1 hypothetical protein N7473_002967 [Penicillium subrubescens]OKO98312.1 hypothetical protein PENSUB_9410 [Penicillium subrubescens]
MVPVTVEGSPSNSGTEEQIVVNAMRTEYSERLSILDLLDPDFDLQSMEDDGAGSAHHETDFEKCTRVHDPEAHVLAETTGCLLVSESIVKGMAEGITTALSPKSPAELVLNVLKYANNDLDYKKKGWWDEPVSPPSWMSTEEDISFRFALLFPTTEEELSKTHAILHNTINKDRQDATITIITISPDQHRVKSRCGFIEFMKECRCLRGNSIFLNFLLSPITEINIVSANFSLVHQGRDSELLVTQVPFKKIVDIKSPWLPVLKHSREKSSYDYYGPLFYLTKQLTEAQGRAVSMDLIMPNIWNLDTDYLKYCGEVRGDREEDGTDQDICNITWKVWQDGRQKRGFFCIDRQSGEDQTVLFVAFDSVDYRPTQWGPHPRMLYDPSLRGFPSSRIAARDTGIIIEDYSVHRRFPMLEHRFRRPGWPARGVLEGETDSPVYDLVDDSVDGFPDDYAMIA